MSSPNLSEGWRSSSSRLLGLYSLLFILWCALLMGGMYWRVDHYLESLVDQSLMQRAQLFNKLSGNELRQALVDNQRYDIHGIDAYGLFASNGTPLAGQLKALPRQLPVDGRVYFLADSDDEKAGRRFALAMHTADGQVLVLVRKSNSLMAVTGIILDALAWGVSLTLVPGLLGWHLLRQRPLRRIRKVQEQMERISAGDLTRRLPLSNRRDELDMLASIVNAMLERIEQLMGEVKSSSDAIAHDLRTPLTRLRALLYRTHQQVSDAAGENSVHARSLEKALAETDQVLARFRALLRISELEDHRRRSNFIQLDIGPLLQELHEFYAPSAEERGQVLDLRLAPRLPLLTGDPELLFEAFGNLLANAIKFSPPGGRIQLTAERFEDAVLVGVHDSGPGINVDERDAVLKRFYRGVEGHGDGFGLGLSIVAAITALHGFSLKIESSRFGGACIYVYCRTSTPLL